MSEHAVFFIVLKIITKSLGYDSQIENKRFIKGNFQSTIVTSTVYSKELDLK